MSSLYRFLSDTRNSSGPVQESCPPPRLVSWLQTKACLDSSANLLNQKFEAWDRIPVNFMRALWSELMFRPSSYSRLHLQKFLYDTSSDLGLAHETDLSLITMISRWTASDLQLWLSHKVNTLIPGDPV